MTPEAFLARIVNPGLDLLASLGGPQPTDNARRFIATIGMQESGADLRARYQNSPAASPGPAKGWFQFEQGGGVVGVLTHASTQALAATLCEELTVVPTSAAVHRALEGHDLLAVGFARLLILTYPKALPITQEDGWVQYLGLWRPGKPHPEKWPGNWATADRVVSAAATVAV